MDWFGVRRSSASERVAAILKVTNTLTVAVIARQPMQNHLNRNAMLDGVLMVDVQSRFHDKWEAVLRESQCLFENFLTSCLVTREVPRFDKGGLLSVPLEEETLS